jgi:hypothetical protein
VIEEISDILARFESCFHRRAAFSWFVVIIFGLLVRLDQHGVTSLIRWLGLEPDLYLSCLSFFRATSWTLADLQLCWSNIVKEQCPLITVGGSLVIIGDGIKVTKDARRMPAVKKLHQESANSGKAEYIFGHHHGVLGILAGSAKKMFCVPIAAEIHEGMQKIREFKDLDDFGSNDETRTDQVEATDIGGMGDLNATGAPVKASIITSMAAMACDLAKRLDKKCILVLDAYFAAGPAFLMIKDLADGEGKRLLHLVTRAKSNVVAYECPTEQTTKRRGRPRFYGKKVILAEVFRSRRSEFQQVEVVTYGKKKRVSCLCLDLIWKPIKDKVRFVLVIDGADKFILMCSDLLLDPVLIINAYGYRFKIEVCLKMLKLLVGTFCYHFWTKALPKRDCRENSDLDSVTDKKSQAAIVKAARAIEGFVNFGCIATGILQLLALKYEQLIWKSYRGWLRTSTSEIPSEETVMSVIQESFFHNFHSFSHAAIYAIITAKKRNSFTERYRDAA